MYICTYRYRCIYVYTHTYVCNLQSPTEYYPKGFEPCRTRKFTTLSKMQRLLNYYPNTFKPLNKSRKGTTPKGFKPVRPDRLPPQKL